MAMLPLYLSAFLVLFARVGAMLMLLPIFSDDSVPTRIRLVMALGMTLALWGMLAARVVPAVAGPAGLPQLIIVELIVGLALGMIVRMMFHAAAMSASLISGQIGLSSALIADPSLGGQATVLSKLVSVAAVLFCLAGGVHHLWIAAIIRSYNTFPVGAGAPAGDFLQLALATISQSMTLALGLAAPLIVYGIVFNVGLGITARLTPALQVFFIAQPLNLMLGIAITAGVGGMLLAGFADAISDWMRTGWA